MRPNCKRATCVIACYLKLSKPSSSRDCSGWPFPLAYPLGKPNHPAFQRRVIEAGLNLLNRPFGPVL